MKQKEIKNLAQKIAKLEKSLETASLEEKGQIEHEIMTLCSKVKSIDDIIRVDELVAEILKKS